MRLNGAHQNSQRFTGTSVYSRAQLTTNALDAGFSREATNVTNLLTVAGAGLSYQLGRTLTHAAFNPLSARYASRILAPIVGLNLEVGTIHGIQHFTGSRLPTQSHFGDSSYLSTLVDIGSLKTLGFMSGSLSHPLQQMIQSVGMAGVHRASSAVGLTPQHGQGSFAEEVVNAQVLNLELGASGALSGLLGARRIQVLERSLQANQGMRFSPEEVSRVLREERSWQLQGMAAEAQGFWASRIACAASRAKPFAWDLSMFRFSFRRLPPAERAARFVDLVAEFNQPRTNDAREKFIDAAVREAITHLSPEQINEIGQNHLLNSLNRVQGLHQERILRTLQEAFPHFTPDLQDVAIVSVMREMTRPGSKSQGAAQNAFLRCLSALQRSQILRVAEAFRDLRFSAVESMDYMEASLQSLFENLASTRTQEVHEDIVREIRLFNTFLSHPVFKLGVMAHDRMVSLLQELPEREARPALDLMASDVSGDFLTNLRWVEEFERRRVSPDASIPAWIRTWEQQRQGITFERVRSVQGSLQFPAEWASLTRQANEVRSLQDVAFFRNTMRALVNSTEAQTRAAFDAWWNAASMPQRWLMLQVCVGSQGFWKMQGSQAMRIRRMTLRGFGNETGIASTEHVIRDRSDAFFILGDRDSVGVPHQFIQEYGIEEARRYMMVHHSHPTRGPRDYNQIYPSTRIEGAESGDLHAMFNLLSSLHITETAAFSLTHEDGGTVFVMRPTADGGKTLEIYSGRRPEGEDFNISTDFMLSSVRQGIRDWAAHTDSEIRKQPMDVTLWEVPFSWIEEMSYPNAPADHPAPRVRIDQARQLN